MGWERKRHHSDLILQPHLHMRSQAVVAEPSVAPAILAGVHRRRFLHLDMLAKVAVLVMGSLLGGV